MLQKTEDTPTEAVNKAVLDAYLGRKHIFSFIEISIPENLNQELMSKTIFIWFDC